MLLSAYIILAKFYNINNKAPMPDISFGGTRIFKSCGYRFSVGKKEKKKTKILCSPAHGEIFILKISVYSQVVYRYYFVRRRTVYI